MDIIKHKSYGPIAALKREFRKQIFLMGILPVCLLLTNSTNIGHALSSILFWAYVALCAAVVIFSYKNYRIVERMEGMDGMVKPNLEKQINTLDSRLKAHVWSLRVMILLLIALLEIVPYIQHFSMLDKWHSLDLWIRLASYACFMVLQFFTSKAVCDRRFGSHLRYLKGLVKEME